MGAKDEQHGRRRVEVTASGAGVPRPGGGLRPPALALVTVLVGLGACGDSPSEPRPQPASLSPATAQQQTATVGAAVSQPPAVIVRDASGDPVPGVDVTFAVISGGGSVTGAAATTDAAGRAQVGSWTLGTGAGPQVVRATVAGLTPIDFTAEAQAGPPAAILPAADNPTEGVAGTPVTPPPGVVIRDAHGNPVPGAQVTFAVSAGGGSITGATATTDASGVARVGSWTLGVAGTNRLVASSAGLNATLTVEAQPGAASLQKVAGDGQTAPVGTPVPVPPSVRVLDADGEPVQGVTVTFEVVSGGGTASDPVQTTDADGIATVGEWVLGGELGQQRLSATAAGVTAVQFTATATVGAPATLEKISGDNQSAPVGSLVPIPPAVLVEDAFGNPVPGVTVTFAVTGGGGSVTDPVQVTDAEGVATVGGWRLGDAAGANTLSATAAGLGSVVFTATGLAGGSAYSIQLSYVGGATQRQQQAFAGAVTRWTEVVTGELPDVQVDLGAGACGGVPHPAVSTTVDDLLIFVHLDSIDGVGSTLGVAGPCLVRSTSRIPIVGVVKLDTADLVQMEANGTLDEVVLHEMGHVLGIGTLWSDLNLLVGAGGSDPYFSGAGAIAAFEAAGGNHPDGVPVENTGSAGTRDSHWRESVLGNELMTGFISGVGNPLSAITVTSLADMGYVVDTGAADAFTIGSGMAAAMAGAAWPLEEVLLKSPRGVPDGP